MSGGYPLVALPPNPLIGPWVEKMQSVGVRTRRHVLARGFKPPMSWFLYKYCSSDRIYSHQNLRDTIVGSVLRLNSPSTFNDPFELAAHFTVNATEHQKLARFEALIRQQMPHAGWRKIQAGVQGLMTSTEEGLRPILNRSLQGVRDRAGIYCFAGAPRSTLMWSHYASEHKGACLVFERAYDVHTFCHAFRVRHTRKLTQVNWVRNYQKGIMRLLFAKHPAWKYEKESRIMITGGAARYLSFAPQALRGIIFGCRAEPKFIETVKGFLRERATAGHPALRVYWASTHPREYRLVVHQTRTV
jgi:hypothetical protein